MISKSLATVNPCSMCMPMGSVLVFRGIEGCMPLFHGSQGCSTYMRLYLAHHFREPVDIASTALSEKGAVYGGSANLMQGLKNVIKGYNPKVIGIATTCLAETIGDDVPQIVREFQAQELLAKDVIIISVSTPSYAASHEVGYRVALKALIQTIAKKSKPNGRINMLVGSIISPADVRFLRRLFDDWGLGYILMPDISETFDAILSQDLPLIPKGGTPLEDIRDTANSKATLTIGGWVQEPGAGNYLENEFKVPHVALPLPIGLEFTDRLAANLEELTGLSMPECYERERGRLLDTMVDAHKILADVKTAVYGDTEMVLGITRIMTELGMKPQIVATGAANPAFAENAAELAPGSKVMMETDFSQIATEASSRDIELLVGPFMGRGIARKENIPLLRVGLPNHDRYGASHQLLLGYEGSMNLVEGMANALLEGRERGTT
ncbi:MAG: nitrogenase associated protein N [Methanothrix sp.]|jgi:nitrogenase molybdenum-iron protein NifN|nr:nitrogenase associated protein N [Methanothrix sp.]